MLLTEGGVNNEKSPRDTHDQQEGREGGGLMERFLLWLLELLLPPMAGARGGRACARDGQMRPCTRDPVRRCF